MERPIEGPEPYQPRLSSHDAGKWLNGISDRKFEELMARHLPSVQPILLHERLRVWNWLDVACLAYVLGRAGGKTPPPPEE